MTSESGFRDATSADKECLERPLSGSSMEAATDSSGPSCDQRMSWSLIVTDYALSARRADRVLGLSRSARHYRLRPRDDGPIIDAIQKHLEVDPRHGFSLPFRQTFKPRGFGKTRSWRVYCALRLNLSWRGKWRLPERIRKPLEVPLHANRTWSADFMADALWSRRRFRTFNVNDDYNRGPLRIEIDTSPPHKVATHDGSSGRWSGRGPRNHRTDLVTTKLPAIAPVVVGVCAMNPLGLGVDPARPSPNKRLSVHG